MMAASSNAAPAVLMVRPANFGPNPQTADSNAFQSNAPAAQAAEIHKQALIEFDEAVKQLRSAGVSVLLAEDEYLEERRDAIFPNNWVSFHADGRVFLYPMMAPARRTERRLEVVREVERNFVVKQLADISGVENQGKYLEGTGSLIFDHMNRVVYASRSPRTDEQLVKEHAYRLGVKAIIFDAFDWAGSPIYHTNVLMTLGSGYCVICLSVIPDGPEKEGLISQLTASGHELIEISVDQMEHFAGNMLEVASDKTAKVLVMSTSAHNALSTNQKKILEKYINFIAIDIPTIEKYGGGSARCMMAGIHLPKK